MNTHTDQRDAILDFEHGAVTPDAIAGGTIGAQLSGARRRRGHSLDDIAGALKIQTTHLHALEEGWWDELPSQAYALGFLRSYARHLGLDDKALVARCKAENGCGCAPTHHLAPQPIEESRIPRMTVVILSAFLALAGYCGWYFMAGSSYTAAETANVIPPRLAALATAAANGTDFFATAGRPIANSSIANPSVAYAAVLPVEAAQAPVKVAAAAPVAASKPAPQIAMVETPDIPLREHVHIDARQVSMLTPSRFAAPSFIHAAHASSGDDPASRITLRAKADTWILIADADAKPLRQGVLKAGEQYRAPDRNGLTLTTSNINGLEILVDGVAVRADAPGNAIERDMPLDADKLAAATL